MDHIAHGVGSIHGLQAKVPHALQSRNQHIKRSDIVTNLVKTLKIVHILKIYLKKRRNQNSCRSQDQHRLGYFFIYIGQKNTFLFFQEPCEQFSLLAPNIQSNTMIRRISH